MTVLAPYCSGFLCTDVDREGTMRGANPTWFRQLRSASRVPIVAAGGISTKREIKALERTGMAPPWAWRSTRIVFASLASKQWATTFRGAFSAVRYWTMRTLRWAFFFLLFILSLFIAAPKKAQAPAKPSDTLPFQLKRIGPDIWAAIDDAKGDAGANAGFVIGDEGVAVIDTFENEAAAKALLSELHRLTRLPVKFVVNTHYHLDHVAGNHVFSQEGAVIVAHQNVPAWIHSENLKFFSDKIKPEEKAIVQNLLGPSVVYEKSVTLYLGSRRVDVRCFEGHTGGDSVVLIPDAGVVFCGDLFWRKTLPNLIDATLSAWIPTLSQLASLRGGTATDSPIQSERVFVPGHGDVGNAADVLEFQEYLKCLQKTVQKALDEGKKGDELVNFVLPELTKTNGTWNFFKYFSLSNILDTAAELQGLKRVPPRQQK